MKSCNYEGSARPGDPWTTTGSPGLCAPFGVRARWQLELGVFRHCVWSPVPGLLASTHVTRARVRHRRPSGMSVWSRRL